MRKILKIILAVLLLLIAGALTIIVSQVLSRDADATYELRGRYKTSKDGKTYLVIEDNNGGHCGPLYVDKKEWAHGLNSKGEVAPGEHNIECGTGLKVTVKEGTTYYFNYWGP